MFLLAAQLYCMPFLHAIDNTMESFSLAAIVMMAVLQTGVVFLENISIGTQVLIPLIGCSYLLFWLVMAIRRDKEGVSGSMERLTSRIALGRFSSSGCFSAFP